MVKRNKKNKVKKSGFKLSPATRRAISRIMRSESTGKKAVGLSATGRNGKPLRKWLKLKKGAGRVVIAEDNTKVTITRRA